MTSLRLLKSLRDSEKRPHEQLEVWQDAMGLVELIYALSFEFPAHERFGLAAPIRRAASSVPSNVAEGAARQATTVCLRFPSVARNAFRTRYTNADSRSPQTHRTVDDRRRSGRSHLREDRGLDKDFGDFEK